MDINMLFMKLYINSEDYKQQKYEKHKQIIVT